MSNKANCGRRHDAALALFALGLLTGLYRVSQDIPAAGAGFEVIAVATSIVRDGAFANPFAAGGTGPTAIIPPLYPAYLALLMKLSPSQFAFGLLMVLSMVIAFAVHAAVLPAVSNVLLGDRRPGIYAGILAIAGFQIVLIREAMYLATGFMSRTGNEKERYRQRRGSRDRIRRAGAVESVRHFDLHRDFGFPCAAK
jgi:hypothetical protein